MDRLNKQEEYCKQLITAGQPNGHTSSNDHIHNHHCHDSLLSQTQINITATTCLNICSKRTQLPEIWTNIMSTITEKIWKPEDLKHVPLELRFWMNTRLTYGVFWMQLDQKLPSFEAQLAYFCPRKRVDFFHAALTYKDARVCYGQIKRNVLVVLKHIIHTGLLQLTASYAGQYSQHKTQVDEKPYPLC